MKKILPALTAICAFVFARQSIATNYDYGENPAPIQVSNFRQVASISDYEYREDPDPIQGLEALAERHGHKPFDLCVRDGALLNRRTIFRDRQFGTQVWMVDDSHTLEYAGTASIWPAWNANGSLLYLNSRRIQPNGRLGRGWFASSDFSRLKIATGAGGTFIRWDRHDPDLLYGYSPGRVSQVNVVTGERTPLAAWQAHEREQMYGTTSDGKYAFIDAVNGGIWLPYEPDDDNPVPKMIVHDGRPAAPDGSVLISGAVSSTVHTEKWGHLFRVRLGRLVCNETGDYRRIIAPLCGEPTYLETFRSGRVRFPEEGEWGKYGLDEGWNEAAAPVNLSVEELFEKFRYLPWMGHGHSSISADGKFYARDGPTQVGIYGIDAGKIVSAIPLGRTYHLHWKKHPLFFVGWVRGWHRRGNLARRVNHANLIYQGFTDGTFQPVFDSKHRVNSQYHGGDFSMLSPDATKIHTASSMIGIFKTYVAVMARPRPPRNLAWKQTGETVALTWEPSAYSRETRGYLVYRSGQSGDGYELLTPEPVSDTSWRDATIVPGKPYYYVVTSLEHSGLESGYGNEAARAGVDLSGTPEQALVVYMEAEESIRRLDGDARPGLSLGADRWNASDWYYIYRHPEAEQGKAPLDLNIPAGGDYYLWARVRSGDEQHAAWRIGTAKGTFDAGTSAPEWIWVRANENAVRLPEGETKLALETGDRHAQLDLLCLATDKDFIPSGPRPENTTPPPPVGALRAENVRERANHLQWEGPDNAVIAYYQVYASREPIAEIAQELLVGSPTDNEMIDWGLKAGTMYYYAVTAVDRQGNESAPVMTQAATPEGDPRILITLTFDKARKEGAFDISAGEGTYGAHFVVPKEPEKNVATWEIDIPRDDNYYLWLRYLTRGSGRSTTYHDLNVQLNGNTIMKLEVQSDLNVSEEFLAAGHPLAPSLWTWHWPGPHPAKHDLIRVKLPAGKHSLTLEGLHRDLRYDALVITSDPAWQPPDGRIR